LPAENAALLGLRSFEELSRHAAFGVLWENFLMFLGILTA